MAKKHTDEFHRGAVRIALSSGLVYRQTVTPGNAHESTERDALLLGDEAALYADAAYSSQATRKKLEQFGIDDQVQRKGYRSRPLPVCTGPAG